MGSSGFLQNILLYRESGYFDTTSSLKPLMHLWSLGVEEQFYLTFPLLIWLVWRFNLNILVTLLSIGVISFGLNIYFKSDPVGAFFLPYTRFWEMLLGSVLAYITLFKPVGFDSLHKVLNSIFFRMKLKNNYSSNLLGNILSILSVALLVTSLVIIEQSDFYPGWWSLLPVLSAVLIIFSGPHAWVNKYLLSNKLVVWIGLISYPLYLWHWPLLAFLRIIESDVPSITMRGAAIGLSFILAAGTYQFI
jgi:peptidoglycan/LPS O-acetylase OafA/YrhL